MAGVESLRVIHHPLASNPEDASGPGIVQQTSDFLRSYNITPEVTLVSTGVGLALGRGVSGALQGALLGSLMSLVIHHFQQR